MLHIEAKDETCGAIVHGVDFSAPVDAATIADIRRAWLDHHVLIFPEQTLSDADLVRFTLYFGELGDDPFFESIAPDNPVFALTRRADEKAPLFAESWHTDWSFMKHPPIGSCLYSLVIPPVGGETGFANQQLAARELPAALRGALQNRKALHSAALPYAPDGAYGDREEESDRSMKIITNEKARETQLHEILTRHPESGNETVFGSAGYIIGIEGMPDDEARDLIAQLYAYQTQEAFQYKHKWQPDMLVLWDNRSLLHRAFGGFDGYDRELHRTTIAGSPEYSVH